MEKVQSNRLVVNIGVRVIMVEDFAGSKRGEVGTIEGYRCTSNGAIVLNVEMDSRVKFHGVPAELFINLPEDDPNRQEILKLLDKQFSKGVYKYGGTLADNPLNLSVVDMIDYVNEELMDAIHYNMQLKRMVLAQDAQKSTAIEDDSGSRQTAGL